MESFDKNAIYVENLEDTHGLGLYILAGYKPINGYLRANMTDDAWFSFAGSRMLIKKKVSEIDSQMNHTLESDCYVYRGVNGSPNLDTGLEFVDRGFVSTTIRADIAESIENGKNTVFRIKVPKGTKVAMIQGLEKEVLLPRNLKFRVIGRGDFQIIGGKPNVLTYDLEVVSP